MDLIRSVDLGVSVLDFIFPPGYWLSRGELLRSAPLS